jgi:hypothetical protein
MICSSSVRTHSLGFGYAVTLGTAKFLPVEVQLMNIMRGEVREAEASKPRRTSVSRCFKKAKRCTSASECPSSMIDVKSLLKLHQRDAQHLAGTYLQKIVPFLDSQKASVVSVEDTHAVANFILQAKEC